MFGYELYERLLKHGPLFLFLDYDGTLVETANHPRDAWPSKKLILLLRGIIADSRHAVAIISGRPLVELEARFPFPGLWLVGSHGAEMISDDGQRRCLLEDNRQAISTDFRARATDFVSSFPGCFVESKPFGVAFHFRQACAAIKMAAKAHFLDTYREFAQSEGVEILEGDEVLELRPSAINKGTAVSYLLNSPHAKGLHPVCFGNDATDEDAFRILSDVGVTVSVGNGLSATMAHYKLPDPHQVCAFLGALQANTKTKEKVI